MAPTRTGVAGPEDAVSDLGGVGKSGASSSELSPFTEPYFRAPGRGPGRCSRQTCPVGRASPPASEVRACRLFRLTGLTSGTKPGTLDHSPTPVGRAPGGPWGGRGGRGRDLPPRALGGALGRGRPAAAVSPAGPGARGAAAGRERSRLFPQSGRGPWRSHIPQPPAAPGLAASQGRAGGRRRRAGSDLGARHAAPPPAPRGAARGRGARPACSSGRIGTHIPGRSSPRGGMDTDGGKERGSRGTTGKPPPRAHSGRLRSDRQCSKPLTPILPCTVRRA